MTRPSSFPSRPPRSRRRQDPRYLVELPITLTSVKVPQELMTWDVSARGLFVQTSEPLPPRRLVRFRLVSPQEGEVLVFHGTVTAVVGPDDPEGRPQGMGVELFAIDPETRRRWWAFVQSVRDDRQRLDRRSSAHGGSAAQ